MGVELFLASVAATKISIPRLEMRYRPPFALQRDL
jgi:hypothetical protein